MWLLVSKTHCFGTVRLGLLCSGTKGIWQPNNNNQESNLGSCTEPCFRSCSWEHTSLEHAQLPGQKRSSSCLFIFLTLKFFKCKPKLSESNSGESRKSTSPSGLCQTRGLASHQQQLFGICTACRRVNFVGHCLLLDKKTLVSRASLRT